MQRHHLNAVVIGVGLAFAGFQHRMRQEGFERRQFRLGFRFRRKSPGRAHQFQQILDPPLAALALLLLEMLDETAHLDDVIDLLMKFETLNFPRQFVDQSQEGLQRQRGPLRETALHAGLRAIP